MKYYVIPSYGFKEERIQRFIDLRSWCWSTFDYGVERKYITLHPGPSNLESGQKWAWHSEDDNLRIYFKSDEELALFKLKWL